MMFGTRGEAMDKYHRYLNKVGDHWSSRAEGPGSADMVEEDDEDSV